MAGSNTKDIKTRIKAVQNTQKVTKSMKLLSQIKLQQLGRIINSSKKYAEGLLEIARKASAYVGDIKFSKIIKAFVSGQSESDLIIAIAADKGLCGAYNTNVAKYLRNVVSERGHDVDIVTVGKKIDRFVTKAYQNQKSVNIIKHVENNHYDASGLGHEIYELFLMGKYRSVMVIYTQYISSIKFENKALELLPLDMESFVPVSKSDTKAIVYDQSEMLIEPSPETVLECLIPLFVENRIQEAVNNARASEMASRVTAMSSATDNATKLIGELTLKYNKVRQAGITQEISEIVVGVESMKN